MTDHKEDAARRAMGRADPDDMGIDEPHASTAGPILGILALVIAVALACLAIWLWWR